MGSRTRSKSTKADPFPGRCIKRSSVPGTAARRRCTRKAKRDGYCTQHHPDYEDAQRKKWQVWFKQQRAAAAQRERIEEAQFAVQQAALRWLIQRTVYGGRGTGTQAELELENAVEGWGNAWGAPLEALVVPKG